MKGEGSFRQREETDEDAEQPGCKWTWNSGNMERRGQKRAHTARFHLYETPRIGKSLETESILVIARGGDYRREGPLNGHEGS